jgi:hypothetical protein
MGYIRARASALGNDIIAECHLSTLGSRAWLQDDFKENAFCCKFDCSLLTRRVAAKIISSGRNIEDVNVYEE